jgi:hypothetical protein
MTRRRGGRDHESKEPGREDMHALHGSLPSDSMLESAGAVPSASSAIRAEADRDHALTMIGSIVRRRLP